ncbi:DUF397 domain-containing protein [Actinoalloteichus spitiensis]|uniref:DUF397 domain-containing protein n=1 Tax=Actinoalloteichus spitiensis TaxID=252394 RepID=UPI0002EA0929|nr:DUF397 domain-containing protein [Actinoalloteichus spitiensis]
MTSRVSPVRHDRSARSSWFKSTRSAGNSSCVEVRFVSGAAGVRDSKNPRGPALVFASSDWSGFVGNVRRGSFDDTP